jgi:transcriptional regulator with XRE-family HTH domain
MTTQDLFAERIQELINEFGRKELASKTGISPGQFQKLRTGGDTTRRNLIALADAANVRFEWLGKGVSPKRSSDPEPTTSPAPEFTNDEIEMIDLFRKAPLMLKMQTIQMLSTGQPAQTGSISVSGNENTTAGRDVN